MSLSLNQRLAFKEEVMVIDSLVKEFGLIGLHLNRLEGDPLHVKSNESKENQEEEKAKA